MMVEYCGYSLEFKIYTTPSRREFDDRKTFSLGVDYPLTYPDGSVIRGEEIFGHFDEWIKDYFRRTPNEKVDGFDIPQHVFETWVNIGHPLPSEIDQSTPFSNLQILQMADRLSELGIDPSEDRQKNLMALRLSRP